MKKHTLSIFLITTFIYSSAQAGTCKDGEYQTGYTPKVLDSKKEKAYIGSTGHIPGVTVSNITPNSPIALAGLNENDVITSVNGQIVKTTGHNISRDFAQMFNESTQIAGANDGVLILEVLSDKVTKRIIVKPIKSCD